MPSTTQMPHRQARASPSHSTKDRNACVRLASQAAHLAVETFPSGFWPLTVIHYAVERLVGKERRPLVALRSEQMPRLR